MIFQNLIKWSKFNFGTLFQSNLVIWVEEAGNLVTIFGKFWASWPFWAKKYYEFRQLLSKLFWIFHAVRSTIIRILYCCTIVRIWQYVHSVLGALRLSGTKATCTLIRPCKFIRDILAVFFSWTHRLFSLIKMDS